MISLIISEKGGAERRERYDQNEITVGRVKGNDVMLAKGNVSKRHARLIVRDGRYIVTDLKSTNGTYVNHRRITHATLVREGDRIYVGDFVLRIESEAEVGAGAEVAERGSGSPGSPRSVDSSTAGSGVARASVRAAGSVTPPEGARRQEEVVSHFPIEHDPDDSSPSVNVPAAPRMPSGLRPSSTGSGPAVSSLESPLTTDGIVPPTGIASSAAVSSDQPVTPLARVGHAVRDEADRAVQRHALDALLTALEARLGDALDAQPSPSEALIREVDGAVSAEVTRLSAAGLLPGDLEPSALAQTAREELLALGPLGPLIHDENISHVGVMRREVVVHRRGQRLPSTGLGFGTERGVARVLRRLAAKAGRELGEGEPEVEIDLPGGLDLFAVRPPLAPDGHLLVLRRPKRSQATLNALVRAGAISRSMATLLTHCIGAHANVLVTGAPDSGADELIGALAGASAPEDRALWLVAAASPGPGGDYPTMALAGAGDDGARVVAAAARLRPDLLVVPALLGPAMVALLEAINRGTTGVLAAARAATLRKAVSRISTDVAATRALGIDTAREWLAASFDLGLEVTRLGDGRLRVTRMAELRSGLHGAMLRDIFTFACHRTAAGGSVEGAFCACGTVPRIVEDLAARGMPLDTAIFRRNPTG